MYGEKRQLITFQCRICNTACPLWVDREDLERAKLGVPVQFAFANRTGQAYLTVPEFQLFLTGSCDRCQQTGQLRNAHPACRRCVKTLRTAGVCSDCLEVVQLCGEIGVFVEEIAPLLQAALKSGSTPNIAEMFRIDFTTAIVVFGVADGPLVSSELAILADLWCYLLPAEVNSTNAMTSALALAEAFLKANPKPVPTSPQTLSLVETYDRIFETQYARVLRSFVFRLANVVVKTDGVISDAEMEFLKYYEMILRTPAAEHPRSGTAPPQASSLNESLARENTGAAVTPNSGAHAPPAQSQSEPSLEATLTELNSLIGLHQVKAEVGRLVNFLNVERLKQSRGFKSAEVTLHLEFYGNPGTGKTTVARLMAQIYRGLGFLSRGHLVEADRSRLVAGWLGQTAIKTKAVIEEALGGVLFIDEAYSLARTDSQEDIFGKEAIETVLKGMEDHRDDLVVIVAGYPDEMAKFFSSNPGLKSRLNRFIDFEDYSPDELFQIFNNLATRAQYKISASAAERLQVVLLHAFENKDRNFGNGRFARNIFQASIQRLATRLVRLARVTDDDLMTIEAADIPDSDAVAIPATKGGQIGFEVPQQKVSRERQSSATELASGGFCAPIHRKFIDIDDLEHDPQEDDPRLRTTFDAAHREAEESMRGQQGRSFGRRLASRMKDILKTKYGIEWKTVFEMNPDLHVD